MTAVLVAVLAAAGVLAGGESALAQDPPAEPTCVAATRLGAVRYEFGTWKAEDPGDDDEEQAEQDGDDDTIDVEGMNPVAIWPKGTCLTGAVLTHDGQKTADFKAYTPVPGIDDTANACNDDGDCDYDPKPSGWQRMIRADSETQYLQFITVTAADGTQGWVEKAGLTAYDRAAFRPWTFDGTAGAWHQFDPNPTSSCLATAGAGTRIYTRTGDYLSHRYSLSVDTCFTSANNPYSGQFEPHGYNGANWMPSFLGTQMCFLNVDSGYIDAAALSWSGKPVSCP
ncbi:hypothetical protein [Glycomyces dulcitolivorans]|uniref:hypothetical protein n=1 Tax=Glycomyces dulcitolivorans TaxID=2200759 RepID=UPI001300502A|nr:hypothetical protein [Glycomyces dulcitolivorans]